MCAFLGIIAMARFGKLLYPTEQSEFEIQSYVYTGLRQLGFDVRGEVSSSNAKSRFDLVVFVDKRPVLIIETKRTAESMVRGIPKEDRRIHLRKIARDQNKQLDKYLSYGVPVAWVNGSADAARLVNIVADGGLDAVASVCAASI